MITQNIIKGTYIFLKFKNLNVTKTRFGINNSMLKMNNKICKVIDINLNDDKISLEDNNEFDYYCFSFTEISKDSSLCDRNGTPIDLTPYEPPQPKHFDVKNLYYTEGS